MFALFVFLISPIVVAKEGVKTVCKADEVVGSYVNFEEPYLFQLTLGTGSIANLYTTLFPDFMITFGTQSPFIGSWECRKDGTLLVTFLMGNYAHADSNPYTGAPISDISLASHDRATYLFNVESIDSLRLIQSALRRYSLTQDPTDAGDGSFLFENAEDLLYKRLIPSNADLLP